MFTDRSHTVLPVAMSAARNLVSQRASSLPIDICAVAEDLGFHIEEAYIQAAGYIPEGENTIVVKRDDPLTRKRFTVAHEIGHILWREVCADHSQTACTFRKCAQTWEERVADKLAAELLMPKDSFETALLKYPKPSFGATYSLAQLFGVSFESCIWRITELGGVIACAYWYEVNKADSARCEIRYKKGYSTRPGLRFIDPPVDAVRSCVDHIVRFGGRWRSFLRFRIGDREILLPVEAELTKKSQRIAVRILGWRHLDRPLSSVLERNQLVI